MVRLVSYLLFALHKPPAETVTIVEPLEGERPLTAASARTVRDRDLRLRPVLRPRDLLGVAPGLVAVQHAGGGKADQYFLRGFDADHGTDVALSLDGLPINMVSHGHGQGYADTSFVIPELIERVDVSKGPYFADAGDFASAGAIDLVTRDRGRSFVSAGGGSFDTLRGVAVAAPALGNWHPLVAAEAIRTDGPFEHPERFRKAILHAKLTYDLDTRSSIAVAANAYTGSWRASGQLPARAVASGLVGRFGSLDPTEGGRSSREDLYLTWRVRPDAGGELAGLVYLTSYDFDLFSNFTLFARDPVAGDQIEQWDARTVRGARASYRWLRSWGPVFFDSAFGASARADAIRNGLAHTRARARLAKVVEADVAESAVGIWAREDVQPLPWLRAVLGVRADLFTFRVDDRLEAPPAGATSGTRGAAQVSPKASLIASPHRTTDLFANFGHGFHSNDARGVVRAANPVTPLARTVGYELGARTRLLGHRLELAAALWRLDVASEIVWVGDEGTTEASGATRRQGVELEARAQLLPWLFADLDVTLTRARARDGGGAVPLAPPFTLSAGLAGLHASGLRGGLRALHVGERPATEDRFLDAHGFTRVDLFAAYRWRAFELALTIENLLDLPYRAAQFATVSRLPDEPPTDRPPPPAACPPGTRAATEDDLFRGCEDLSFSPGHPFAARVMATYHFD